MQKNQFRNAVPRKLLMPVTLNTVPVAAFAAGYTQAVRLMSRQAGADDLPAKSADLHRSGEFPREQFPYWLQTLQRAPAFAFQ